MSSIHNPSNFEPTAYEVEDYLDNQRPQYCGGPAEAYAQEVDWWREEMVRTFGPDYARKIHHCAHCGNGRVRWITAVRHIPSGDVVVFGSDCTDRLGFANKVAFKLALLKSKADAKAENFKAYQAKQKFLAATPELVAAIEELKANPTVHEKNSFAADVVGKFERYGSLSPAQLTALTQSLARDYERAKQREAEALEVKGDAPSGRQQVTGKVLSTKEHESIYGTVLKMLVKLENNSKVWLTVPSGSGIQREDVITFKATFEPSRDDRHFGFGKRPMLVTNHSAASREAAGVTA